MKDRRHQIIKVYLEKDKSVVRVIKPFVDDKKGADNNSFNRLPRQLVEDLDPINFGFDVIDL